MALNLHPGPLQAAGWLAALHHGKELTPETAEYGIASVIYKARRWVHMCCAVL